MTLEVLRQKSKHHQNQMTIKLALTATVLVHSFKSYEGFNKNCFGVESDGFLALPDL